MVVTLIVGIALTVFVIDMVFFLAGTGIQVMP